MPSRHLVERRCFVDMAEEFAVASETATPEQHNEHESPSENASIGTSADATPPIVSAAHVSDSPLLPQRRFFFQSVGCTEFYQRIFELTGIETVKDDVTRLFLCSEDQDKLNREAHRRKKSAKTRRMRDQFKKTKEGVEKLKKDNEQALSCESGMMGPGVAEDEVRGWEGKNKRGRWKRRGGSENKRLCCKHCGSTTHPRITDSACPKNLNHGSSISG